MHQTEIILTTLTFIFYLSALVISLAGGKIRNLVSSSGAFYLFGLAVLLHTGVMILRTFYSGHLPIFGMYEAALADTWMLGIFTLGGMLFNRKYRIIMIPAVIIIMILFLQGLGYNIIYLPLTISEQSLWVDLHAVFAWIAFGLYGMAFALSLIMLAPSRWGLLSRWGLAEDTLGDTALRLFLLGFLAQTAMIALGSFYSYLLFGAWWKWDPVEILSLISWAVTGLIIHMRLFYGWSRRRFYILVALSFITVLVSYKLLIYFPGWSTYHIFDIDIKMH